VNDNNIEKPIEQALQAQTSIDSSYHKHYIHEVNDGDVVVAVPTKVVVAIIMEALNKTT